MKIPDILVKNPQFALLAGVVVIGGIWLLTRGVKGMSKDIAKGGVDLITGTVSGVTVGIGEAVGIPETNMTECEKAQKEGRTWDASFACPVGTFVKGIFS